jgi:tetratricopeptide (TPR) repeat protein
MTSAILLALALSAVEPPASPTAPLPFMTNKAAQRQDLIETLRRNIQKVEHAMTVTKDLIAHSKAAPYLPDLEFRLAELYVEESRYQYFLRAETENASAGSLTAPEVAILKEKAISIYMKVLADFPDFHDADKVRFYLAHEYRELGKFDKMLEVEQQLVDKNINSPLATEALLIMGDYWFDKADLNKAEGYYQQILKRPNTPATDLANFKMGWIGVNRANHNDAVKYFEAAAIGPEIPGPEAEKRLNVRREALGDLVYSYTEVKPAKGAPAYFQKLSESSQTYLFVLDKLANRYYIKQEYENAIPAFRALLKLSRDPDRDDERADKLYESLRALKGKVPPTAGDVRALVRVAERLFSDPRSSDENRKRAGEDFEVYCRDLATQVQVAAQKADDPKMESEAADAYASYLSLFKVDKWRKVMEKNHAVSLAAAERFVEAGEQFEQLANEVGNDSPEREDLLYTAVGAFSKALSKKTTLSHYDEQEARSAVQQLGAQYVHDYAAKPRASDVEFNVARAFYDEGEYKKAADGFAAFAVAHPEHTNAQLAVQLSMDCFAQLDDFEGERKQGENFLAANLPGAIKSQVSKQMDLITQQQLAETVLKGSTGVGAEVVSPDGGTTVAMFDAAENLKKVAEEHKGTPVGEQALYTAFTTYLQKKDLARLHETGTQFLQDYPQSKYSADIYAVMGKSALESADFEGAATDYEAYFAAFSRDGNARAAMQTAAEIRENTGDYAKAIEDLGKLGIQSSEQRFHITELKYKSGDTGAAQAGAEEALRSDPGNAKAAAMLGRILLNQGKSAEVASRLSALTRPILKSVRPSSPEADAAAEVFFLLGESMYKDFAAMGSKDLERKAGAMQNLIQAYTAAARMGSGQWAVGSLYRIGLAYNSLANDVLDLKKTVPPDQGAALDQQAAAVKGNADEMFNTCVRKARDLEVYNAFALGCVQKGPVDESSGGSSGGGSADQGRVSTFREQLSKNPNDIDALENLGATYLQAGDYHRALLTYTREVQVNGTKGSAYAGIGMSHEKMGELGDAHDAFAKALDVDPTDDLSHADMAGLKCRFGDIEGAKAELSKLHGAPTQVTPVLDPNWSACGSASAHGETP